MDDELFEELVESIRESGAIRRGRGMTKWFKWVSEQKSMSEYLSERENWTPMLTMVARDFLLVGTALGFLFGCYTSWLMFR